MIVARPSVRKEIGVIGFCLRLGDGGQLLFEEINGRYGDCCKTISVWMAIMSWDSEFGLNFSEFREIPFLGI